MSLQTEALGGQDPFLVMDPTIAQEPEAVAQEPGAVVDPFVNKIIDVYGKYKREESSVTHNFRRMVSGLVTVSLYESLRPEILEVIEEFYRLEKQFEREFPGIFENYRSKIQEMNGKVGCVTSLDVEGALSFSTPPKNKSYIASGKKYDQPDHSEVFRFGCKCFSQFELSGEMGFERQRQIKDGTVFDLLYVKSPCSHFSYYYNESQREFLEKIEGLKEQVSATFDKHLSRWKYSSCEYCDPQTLLDMGFDKRVISKTYGVMFFYRPFSEEREEA